MPAERSRNNRRSGSDCNQLVWTTPVEPTVAAFSFADTITPSSFNDFQLPELVDPVDDDGPLSPPSPRRSHGHGRKKPENHIPRPPNAFILFRSSFIKSQHVSTEVETNHSTLSKIIGLTWQNLPEGERKVWHDKAKEALDEHKRKFPTYSFRPSSNKSKNGEKRKVREVGPKDHKRCAKIAELLVEGKKGRELDMAIKEFDKHHVPEIVTRFEAPITERAFRKRRSSSVPALEQPEPFLHSQPSVAPRKPRASSSKPNRHTSASPEAPELPPIAVNSFSTFTFSSQPAPSSASLDFTSFDCSSPQSATFSFDSLSPVYTPSAESMDAPLSVDTSATFNCDWSSPILASPMTPDLMSGPGSPITPALSRCSSTGFLDEMYPSSFAPSPAPDATVFGVNPFLDGSATFDQSADLAHLFQCHPDSALPQTCLSAQPLPGYLPHIAMPGMHDTGMDMGSFSHFMASLPPYAMTA